MTPATSATIPAIDFTQSALRVARTLIGSTLLIGGVGGVIVETEAYDEAEEASHAYGGERPRNAALFGPPGRAYIYRSYGLHWCLNFVCREQGHGAGVLIRAIEPTSGIPKMIARRGVEDPRLLCSGPGRLCEALAVTDALLGKRLDRPPFRLTQGMLKPRVAVGPRIGITKAAPMPWRFGLMGSRFLSKPFPVVAARGRNAR